MVSSGGELVAIRCSGPAYIPNHPQKVQVGMATPGDTPPPKFRSPSRRQCEPEPEAGKGSCSFFSLQVGAKCASACFIRPSAASLADRAGRNQLDCRDRQEGSGPDLSNQLHISRLVEPSSNIEHFIRPKSIQNTLAIINPT